MQILGLASEASLSLGFCCTTHGEGANRRTDIIQANCILGGGSALGEFPSRGGTIRELRWQCPEISIAKDLTIYVAAAQTQWCSGNTAPGRRE